MATTSAGAYNTLLYFCALRGIPTSRLFSSDSSPMESSSQSLSSTTPPAPQKGVPLNPSYMDTHLKEAEEQSYKAAGVLPIAFFTSPPPGVLVGAPEGDESEGESEQSTESEAAATSTEQGKSEPVPYVLLGCEKRYRDRKAKEEGVYTFLNLLGGKREGVDSSAAHTAWREFWEESGQLLSDEAKPFLEHFQGGGEQRRVLWFSHGKYALFIHHLPYPAPGWTTQIADTYRQMETREKGSEMDSLHWVPLPALLEAVRGRPVYDGDGTPYPVFRFSADIIRHLARYLGSVAKGKPHAVPPLRSGSPVRRSPNRSVSASPHAGGQSSARAYHTTPDLPKEQHHPGKQQRARAPSPAVTTTASQPSTPLSAHARPFFPRGHPRPLQLATESETSL